MNRPPTRRHWTRLLVAVVLAALFPACNPDLAGSPGAENKDENGNDVVRVGAGPFMSFAALWVAMEKGYFEDVGITVQTKSYIDGSQSVAPLVAGELDLAGLTMSAGTFNSLAGGAPFKLRLGASEEQPGSATTAINVSQSLAEDGVTSIDDLAALEGKKIGVTATGSINQYMIAKALEQAGVDPRSDVDWVIGLPQPDLVQALGQGRVDATDLAVNLAAAAENEGFGPVVARGHDSAPNAQAIAFAMHNDFVESRRDVAVRFVMAYLQGARDYEAARKNPEQHPEVIQALAKHTTLETEAAVTDLHPEWPYVRETGEMNVESILEQQSYWSDYFDMVEETVPEDQLVDQSVATEAGERLQNEADVFTSDD